MKTGRQINENNERQYYLNTGKTLCQDSEGSAIKGLDYDLNQFARVDWVEDNFLRIPEEGEYYKKPDSGIPTEDVADEAITSNKLADGAVTSNKLSSDIQSILENASSNQISIDKNTSNTQVTIHFGGNDYLVVGNADGTITTNLIDSEAVTSNKIAFEAVTSDKLAENSVDSYNLMDQAVESENLANNAVISRTIQDEAVTSNKIANESIEYNKLSLNMVRGIIPPFNAIINSQIQIMQQSTTSHPTYNQIYFSTYHKLFVTLVDGNYYRSWPNHTIYNGAGIYPNDKQTYHCSSNNRLYFYNAEEETLKELSYDTFDGVISSNALQDGSVTSNKIASGAVTVTKIADLNVTSNKISQNAITSNKIANQSVYLRHLAPQVISQLQGQIESELILLDHVTDFEDLNAGEQWGDHIFYNSNQIQLYKGQKLVLSTVYDVTINNENLTFSILDNSKSEISNGVNPYTYSAEETAPIYVGVRGFNDDDCPLTDDVTVTIYDTLESVLERVKQLENNN